MSEDMVVIDHATKTINGVDVLADITMGIPRGATVILRGTNGSGKTMLLRLMCGLVQASEGSVVVDGRWLGRDCDFPPSVGVFLERPAFDGGRSGFSNLRSLASIRGRVGEDGVCDAMRRMGLDPSLKKPFRTYSLGMRQRLGIAAALMEEPDLVLLDEPGNALDEQGRALLIEALGRERSRGATLVIATHDLVTTKIHHDLLVRLAEGHVEKIEGMG
jgi:ABC-2 type transport system ATP-binding protein